MDSPPVDHGSDRFDYVELDAPVGILPGPIVRELLTHDWCPDCRSNVFARWVGVNPTQVDNPASWSVTVAHDETCPTPHLKRP